MADIVVTTSTTEQTSTTKFAPQTKRERHTRVRSSVSNRLTAWNVRDFVKALDAAGVPDGTLVDVFTSHETKHPTTLSVNFTETVDEEEAPDGDA